MWLGDLETNDGGDLVTSLKMTMAADLVDVEVVLEVVFSLTVDPAMFGVRNSNMKKKLHFHYKFECLN